MKRLIITGPKKASFEDVPMPECTTDGIIVQARVTAISAGTELRVYNAVPVDSAGQFMHENVPFILPSENGYSMVGEVVEIGAEVQDLQVGDRVFVPSPHKEYAAYPAAVAIPLPDSVADKEAVMLNIMEVSHNALRQAAPEPGANVAVIGQGIIGLSLTAYATAFGFRTAVLDTAPTRLEIARQMGALFAASPTTENARAQIIELFGSDGADTAYEATSNWAGIRTAMEVTRTDGKVVVVSRHTTVPDFNPVGHPFFGKRLHLITTYATQAANHRWSERRSAELTIDLLARQRLYIKPMLTHQFAWHELPEIYQRLDAGDRSIVGTTIHWDGSNAIH